MKTLLEKAFFGKDSCLVINFNEKNECYFQFGKANNDKWTWKKTKMNDVELGDILLVLEGKKDKVSFYHSFEKNGNKSTTQIWVDRLGNNVAFKVKEATRAISPGEQQVLITLLRHIILMMHLKL